MSSAKLFATKITWRKHGLVMQPDPDVWWMRTHAMCPVADPVEGSYFKIYFAGRNAQNQSHIGWVIVDLSQNGKVVESSRDPILRPGALGCFDDNGVVPSSIVNIGGKKYLYYVGFKPGGTTRMDLFGGLAISDDGGETFERYSQAPTLDRCQVNPFINTAPYVVPSKNKWLLYYVAGTAWVHRDLPRYNIQYATSDNGIDWQREGRVCIEFGSENENALAKPCVLKDDDIFKMWFAHKGENYRMGYAESLDGINWIRDDTFANLPTSETGWDSAMIEYGDVVIYDDRKFIFYNGNNYGELGFGLAEEI